MIINSQILDDIRVGFQTSFLGGLMQAETQYGRIASTVPSSTKSTKYGWLGKLPSMRKWVGPRSIQNLSEYSYTLENETYELTIGVDREDIEDDNLGVYSHQFSEFGMSVAADVDQRIFGLLKAGFDTECYDGQNFFDTDHPVIDADGASKSVANTDGGTGTGWYLMSTRRMLKPLIHQLRKAPTFVAKDRMDDDNVFKNREFWYGADKRDAVGFGFWQIAWGSKQPLDAAHYQTARESLLGMKGDYDRAIGVMPNLLVVPPSLEHEALELINSERNAAGATNVYMGTAEILCVPWLA